MARACERVMAVITSTSMDGREAAFARAHDAQGQSEALSDGGGGGLEDARFIARKLVDQGFELSNFHPLAIAFSGRPAAFERTFGVRPVRRTFAGGRGWQVEGYDILPADGERLSTLPALFEGRAGMMAIARPPRLVDLSSAPVREVAADLPLWSLPDEMAISLWADGTGTSAATGHGIVVAQIGTGHYRHRFFSDRGYRVLPTLLGPGQQHPQRDDHGHSTGEAACLFGAAPDLRLRPIKGLLDPVSDLLMTADSLPRPDLIINSWGYDVGGDGWDGLAVADPNLHNYLSILDRAIRFVSASGIAVCASSPRGWVSFPACHPDVMAITAASKGRAVQPAVQDSSFYPGTGSPALISDAAKSVRAGLDLIGCTYPVQPGSMLCRPGLHEGSGDEGFAWCDVEQAAAPLAAGRLALLLEQHRGLAPGALKGLLTTKSDLPDAPDGDLARPAMIEAGPPMAAAGGTPQLAS